MSEILIGKKLSVAGKYVINAANANQLQEFCERNNANITILQDKKVKLEYNDPKFVAALNAYLAQHGADLLENPIERQIAATRKIITQLKAALKNRPQIFDFTIPEETTAHNKQSVKDHPKFFIYDFFLKLAKIFNLSALKPFQEWIFGAVDYADAYDSLDHGHVTLHKPDAKPNRTQNSAATELHNSYTIRYIYGNSSAPAQVSQTNLARAIANAPKLRQ